MGKTEFHLFCAWHVIRAWQTKITDLIKNDTKRDDAYAKIYTLLHETDPNAFRKMLPSLLNGLSRDEETEKFAEYFKREYSRCPEQRAYCFRRYAGINTNMNLERLHSQIKHIYLKGKMVSRLDRTIHALMRVVDWKIHDRILILENGKLTYKIRELRKRHITANSLSTQSIVPGVRSCVTTRSVYRKRPEGEGQRWHCDVMLSSAKHPQRENEVGIP